MGNGVVAVEEGPEGLLVRERRGALRGAELVTVTPGIGELFFFGKYDVYGSTKNQHYK